MTRGLRADDMFRLSLVADPRLSPGCRYLAYVRGRLDREADRGTGDVIVTDLETGTEWHPAPPGCRASRPRWSADGRLAFAGSAGGTGQVWLWEPGDAAARWLAGGDGEVVDLDWAPDGSKIALTRAWLVQSGPEPGTAVTGGPYRVDGQPGLATARRRVQVVPVRPGAASGAEPWEVPAGGDADAWLPRWSPDSARLAFLAGGRLRITDGRGTEGRGTEGQAPGPRPGPAHGPVLAFTWAPSGDELAYLAPRVPGEADVDVRLFRWAAGGTAANAGPAELAAGWDRSLGSTVRSDDGRGTGAPALAWSGATGRIYFTVADGGRGRIGWADPAGGGHGYLPGGDRTCLDPSLDPAGRHIAFVSTSPTEPGDVHLAGAGGDGERRVTDANPWLRARSLAATRPVTAGEHDGVPVEGWVTAFGGPGRRPLVVSVHGGPHYPAGWRFSFEGQRLAAQGYAVLTANPPGSGGYGRRFATATRGGWGTADWAGLERLIDDVAARPDIDAGRMAITGVSYGGYLSQLALTRSARFSAAISENGISNLLAAWGAEDDGGAWLAAELGGPPWACPQAYVAASPIAAADRIRTPLLLIHAELDRNCPVGQSEQMFAALRAQGRAVELFVIDGEGHLMNLTGRPSRRLARAQAVDRWLGRYLGQEAGRDDD